MTEIENQLPEQNDAMEMAISNVFNKKRVLQGDKIVDAPKTKEGKKEEPPLKLKEKKEVPAKEDDSDDEIEPLSNEKVETKSPEMDYKAEYEKLQKSHKDTQKSFHEDRKKLAAYKKAVDKFKEDGVLLEEEATLLMNHAHFEELDPGEDSEYLKFHKIWTNEIQQIKKYAANSNDVDQYFNAFQHFVQTASPQEIQDVFSELKDLEGDEVEFTRKMLEIGRQYNEDVYSDIVDSGSIRQLKTKYSEKEASLQKKIVKLEEKVLYYKRKYEDFDDKPANLNLPTSGVPQNSDGTSFDLSSIFNKPYRK